MRRLSSARTFLFRCRSLFRGVPIEVNGQHFRLDESLRRWRMDCESAVSKVLRSSLQAGDLVLDVGANFGLHTLYTAHLVKPSGCVYAFEPVPANLRLLHRNLRLNGLQSVVSVVPKAVSNSPKRYLEMEVPNDEVAVAATLRSHDGSLATRLQVANVRLDDMTFDPVRPLRVIKVDVEGAELEVLRGAENLLRKRGPRLLIEIHSYALPSFGASVRDLNAFLEGCGYRETRLTSPNGRRQDYYHSVFDPIGVPMAVTDWSETEE